MPERPVYADSSPLIGLARIDYLRLLRVLPLPARITEQVWQEVTAPADRPDTQRLRSAEVSGLIAVVQEGDPSDYASLGPGEASTISAARVVGGAVLIDERRARRLLETDPELSSRVIYLTTTALVVRGKREGLISAVRPLLDRLRSESFYLGPRAYEDTLRAADEWPD